jgi:hypothetical protein
VIFDDSVPGTNSNIRSDRAANQSPIDNTNNQITNFGSQDGSNDPTATGATGLAATIGGGDDNTASDNYTTVIGGAANKASNFGATVSGGVFNTASGLLSHVSGGENNVASGSHAEASGRSTTASGFGSNARNDGNIAQGDYSNAYGRGTTAPRAYQDAYASDVGYGIPGPPAGNGSAQTSRLVLRGQTPGDAPGESIELFFGVVGPPKQLILEDGVGYTMVVTAIFRGTVAGNPVVRSFKQTLCFRRDAGVTVLAASGAQEAIGDAAGASWTLVASVGVGPDRVVLTANTGATTTLLRAVALVDFTEVFNV